VGHTRFVEETAETPPGTTLLLYTDGLVERRREPIDRGFERLCDAAVAAQAASVDDLAHAVVSTLVDPATQADDVALLVLRVAHVGAERLSLELPAEPGALAPLRRSLGRYLAGLGMSADEAFALTVAVGEAAANAVEHAYGPTEATFVVEADVVDGEVHVLVRDRGRWRAPRGAGRGRGLELMRALTERADVTQSDDGTEVRLVSRLRAEAVL
jgi:anti-sigma regulatory factor (Ser/Thr protein kinase)